MCILRVNKNGVSRALYVGDSLHKVGWVTYGGSCK